MSVIASGVKPFAANVFASAAGLTFVYFASVRRVFRYEGQFLPAMFATYVVYHLCGTVLVSWGVIEMIEFGLHPAGAKMLPFTGARMAENTVKVGAFPGAGKRVTVDGMTFFRLVDCRIVEEWSTYDNLSVMQQLGLLPAK